MRPTITMRKTQIEVGVGNRKRRPGYRWAPAYYVTDPADGRELHPPVRRAEAYELARELAKHPRPIVKLTGA